MTPGSPAAARLGPGRTEQLAELVVFLLLIVPGLVLGLVVRRDADVGFVTQAIATMLRDVALVALVGFFLWRNGEPPQAVGWTARRAGREALLGVALFLPVSLIAGLVAAALAAAGLPAPSKAPTTLVPGSAGRGLAVLLDAVVAVAEETLFRGYLLLRLRQVTGRRGVAVGLSAVLFAMGHGYEGLAAVVAIGVLGVALALIYEWRGSLVAPIIIHFIQDFIAVVLVH